MRPGPSRVRKRSCERGDGSGTVPTESSASPAMPRRFQLAQREWELGNVPRVRKLLNSLRPASPDEDLRGFEWNYLRQPVRRPGAVAEVSGRSPEKPLLRAPRARRAQPRRDEAAGRHLRPASRLGPPRRSVGLALEECHEGRPRCPVQPGWETAGCAHRRPDARAVCFAGGSDCATPRHSSRSGTFPPASASAPSASKVL